MSRAGEKELHQQKKVAPEKQIAPKSPE